MTVTIEESLSSGFIAMEPLFDKLLKQKFVSSGDAIDYCHRLCLEYGFTVKHETGANRSIYIYCCSRESSKKRPYECQWKVVLSQDEINTWKFRKSSNPNTTEHNHELIKDSIGEEEWPQEVIQKIIQLSRQKGQEIDEIREIIKLQFPHITWNDRRFLNYFMEERKRQKQKEITERVQKLIMSTTKLCSVVAANEDWASCVESDLIKMLNTYRQRTRVSNQSLDTMVDLQMDMIHSEIDSKSNTTCGRRTGGTTVYNNKKRKSSTSATHNMNTIVDGGVQIMSIPSCTLFIRSQPLRSLSEPSSTNNNNSSRRALNDMIASTNQQQQLNASFGVNSVFNLTSPISSPSSTSSIQQRMDYGNNFRSNDMLQSPPIPDSNMMISTTNYGPTSSNHSMYSFSPYQQQQQQSSTANTSGYHGNSNGNGVNSNEFSFEPTSSYGQLTTPSPAPIIVHGNNNRSNSNMYYTSASHIGREPTSSNNNSSGIQQRIMLQQQQQQEYEQQQRHFMDHNIHLPTIRGGVNPHDALVQQQHHHHHMNPNQPQQNWS